MFHGQRQRDLWLRQSIDVKASSKYKIPKQVRQLFFSFISVFFSSRCILSYERSFLTQCESSKEFLSTVSDVKSQNSNEGSVESYAPRKRYDAVANSDLS